MRFLRTRLTLSFAFVVLAEVCLPAADADQPRLDAHGDPLPAEVFMRLGSARFRAEAAHSTALSPDGKKIALTYRQSLVLLDAASGKEMQRFTTPNVSGFGSVYFSPDGKKLGLASSVGFQLRDVSTGELSGRLQGARHPGGKSGVSFSRDGKRLALGSGIGGAKPLSATIWDVETCKQLQSVEVVHTRHVNVTLSGDGKLLATWGEYIGRGDRSAELQ